MQLGMIHDDDYDLRMTLGLLIPHGYTSPEENKDQWMLRLKLNVAFISDQIFHSLTGAAWPRYAMNEDGGARLDIILHSLKEVHKTRMLELVGLPEGEEVCRRPA